MIECDAYKTDRSQPIDLSADEARAVAAAKIKISLYFATWWALNVVFNIYNKKVFNAFPYPWLTSTLSLATGSLMMLISWTTRIAKAPKTDMELWKTLFQRLDLLSINASSSNVGTGYRYGDLDPYVRLQDMREFEDLLTKLNPMAEEFVPLSAEEFLSLL